MNSTHSNRWYRISIALILTTGISLCAFSNVIAKMNDDPPGTLLFECFKGNLGDCEPIAYWDLATETWETCCPCGTNGEGGSPVNCDIPTPDPPPPVVTPPPVTPGCSGPGKKDCNTAGPAGGCDENEAAVGGTSVGCLDSRMTQALTLAAHADYVSVKSDSNCCDSGGSNSASTCSSCGTGNGWQVLENPIPSLAIVRQLIPEDQVSFGSFGRGMFMDRFDSRIKFYSAGGSSANGNFAAIFDSRLKRTTIIEDDGAGNFVQAINTSTNSTFELSTFYSSIVVTDATGALVSDPHDIVLASSNLPFTARVVRRNGWVYEFELCKVPTEAGVIASRVTRISRPFDYEPNASPPKTEHPHGHYIDVSYKQFSYDAINHSPTRQFQIDEITDAYGNVARFSYNSVQQGGQWVVSKIEVNPDVNDVAETTLIYDYHPSGNDGEGLLSTVSVLPAPGAAPDAVSTYSYGLDANFNEPTINWAIMMPAKGGACACPPPANDSIVLTPDYEDQGNDVVNQYTNILQARLNGIQQIKTLITRSADPSKNGWLKVEHDGLMAEVKLGQSIRYFTREPALNPPAPGSSVYDLKFADTYEPEATFLQAYGGVDTNNVPFAMTEEQLVNGLPAVIFDETGYRRDFYYENGNIKRITHPFAPEFEEFWYDENNRIKTYVDRAGFPTFISRDDNGTGNVTQVVCGNIGVNPDGTLAYTPVGAPGTLNIDRIQKIFGYNSDGLLEWSASNEFNSDTLNVFAIPSPEERRDYEYTGKRLTKVLDPAPHQVGGAMTRPETVYNWVGNLLASTNSNGKIVNYGYDEYRRLISTTYGDQTTEQTLYDDANLIVYRKNRVNVVDVTHYGLSGRVGAEQAGYGTVGDLFDNTALIDINPSHQIHETAYVYGAGRSQPTFVSRNSAKTFYGYDYRGRTQQVNRYSRFQKIVGTNYEYQNNQLFKTIETVKTGLSTTYTVSHYSGYSADGNTIRKISTKHNGSANFADNAAVLNAPFTTEADPNYVVTDAVRDVRGNIIELRDPLEITTVSIPDALGRTISQTRQAKDGSLPLTNQSVYDAHGNIIETISETGLVTKMVYDSADNLITRTVGFGAAGAGNADISLTTSYEYTVESKQATMTAPVAAGDGESTTTYIYQTCCDQTTATRNELGHGSIQNKDAAGRLVHSATVEDIDAHTDLLNPVDSLTLGESTTRYNDWGQVQYRTKWSTELVNPIDRNAPPIAGLADNGTVSFPASAGVTTQYAYDQVVFDQLGLDSQAGLQIKRTNGTTSTASITIKPAVDKLKSSIASGGATVRFRSNSSGKATVAISPDEKTMNVSITDALGRNVMNAMMTGPGWLDDGPVPAHLPQSENELISWTCTRHDTSAAVPTAANQVGYDAKEVTSIDQDGYTTRTLINGYGQQVASYDQDNNATISTFDPSGNVLSRSQDVTVVIDNGTQTSALQTELRTLTTEYTYDLVGRQTHVTNPLLHVTETIYDVTTGRVSNRKDAKGQTTSYTYDGLDRIETTDGRIIENNNGTAPLILNDITKREYDAGGRLWKIIDAESKETVYAYDELGQKVSTQYADGSVFDTRYDAAGRPEVMVAHSGKTKTNVYRFSGAIDRIEYRDIDDSNAAPVNVDQFTYDTLLERRTGSTSSDGVERQITYTERGQIKTDTTLTTFNNQNYKVTYGYDARGRNNEIEYPSTKKVEYTFTNRGELDTVKWDGSEIENRAYDEIGRLYSVVRANSVDEARVYDDASRITGIANGTAGFIDYKYDENNNKLEENFSGVMAQYSFSTETPGASQTTLGVYPTGYDEEDRLRNFKKPSMATPLDYSLTRNAIGVVTSQIETGTTTAHDHSPTYELDGFGTDSQTYDPDGQLDQHYSGMNLDWNHAGRMTQAVVLGSPRIGIEGTHKYGYDADGKRIWKHVDSAGANAEHTVYIYAGPNCIAEYSAGSTSASPNQEFVYGRTIDSLLAIVRSTGVLTVLRNQQWSVSTLMDGNNVFRHYTYDVFGKRTAVDSSGAAILNNGDPIFDALDSPYGYTSRRHDEETGLMYFRARYYDTVTGEFISADPKEYADGMSMYSGWFVPVDIDPYGLDKTRPFTDPAIKAALRRRACAQAVKRGLAVTGGAGLCCLVGDISYCVGKGIYKVCLERCIDPGPTSLPPLPRPKPKPRCKENTCKKKWGFESCPKPARTRRTAIQTWLNGKVNVDPGYLPIVTNCHITAATLRPGVCPSGGTQQHCTIWFVTSTEYARPQVRLEASVFECNCCHSKKRGTYAKGVHWSTATQGNYGLPGPHSPVTPVLLAY